jgi:hypothetical protein
VVRISVTSLVAAAVAIFVAVAASPNAHAQGGNDGSIIGYVFDQTGNPLPGIKITASSPTQIGGTRVTYSNQEGMFRLRQLFPGTFQIQASAPKLKTIIQRDVRVGISAPAELNLVMEVQLAPEQIALPAVAAAVRASTARLAAKGGGDLALDVAPGLPELWADPTPSSEVTTSHRFLHRRLS